MNRNLFLWNNGRFRLFPFSKTLAVKELLLLFQVLGGERYWSRCHPLPTPHLYRVIYLSGVHQPVSHFKASPTPLALGVLQQHQSFLTLIVQWKGFIHWFTEFLKLKASMLVFASPQFFKYSSLLTFGSTSLKTLEWGHVANLLQSNTKRHSQTFRTFFRLTPILRSHICVFPDVAHHQATLSNLTKTPAFTVGLTPLVRYCLQIKLPPLRLPLVI